MLNTKLKEPIHEWIVKSSNTEDENRIIEEISNELLISKVTAKLLYDRGLKDNESAKEFIFAEPSLDSFKDPFLMASMTEACEKLEQAVKLHKKTVVYGDYDVDGVTSVSMLTMYLKEMGFDDVQYYIPCRIGEGYGLNKQSLKMLADQGVSLMITVDTGITSVEEIAYAKELGIDTVVTDHHEYRRNENGEQMLPDAPCVNPRRSDCGYPYKEFAGVGVAFKLICALEMRRYNIGCAEASKRVLDRYAELVAIGTVADVMPLFGENREIVKAGLKALESPNFVGTEQLMLLSGGDSRNEKKKPTTGLISFILAPRINAVGRMSHAERAAQLFMTDDIAQAAEIAAELCETNTVRQKEENDILNDAISKIETEVKADDMVIVLDSDTWHHGVIGIVASRITERFGLPSILISFDGSTKDEHDEHDIGKGSGRSVKGVNLVDALDSAKDTLVKFGGHELAAGLTVERGRLEEFKRTVNEYVREKLEGKTPGIKIYADAKVGIDEVNIKLARELLLLEPYGQENPKPQFVIENAEISDITPIKNGKYIKLRLKSDKGSITALSFGISYNDLKYKIGDKVDVLAQIEINDYMGKTDAQLNIKDIRASKELEAERRKQRSLYNDAVHGGGYPAEMLPDRDDFAAVYRFVRCFEGENNGHFNIHNICARLKKNDGYPYIKLRAVLDIMTELGLIGYINENGDTCRITVNKNACKTDIESSELLRTLRRHAV